VPGCGEALGARYALDAAMRATGGQLIAVNATGCLEVFSTPYPETSWRIAWLHSCSGTRRPSPPASGRMKVKGMNDVRVVAQRATEGPSTLDSGASRACSNAMTMSSSSATTMRRT